METPNDVPSRARCLHRIKALARKTEYSQKLRCFQACLELQMGKVDMVLKTIEPYCGKNARPSKWAMHIKLHLLWLDGDAAEVKIFIHACLDILSQQACMLLHISCVLHAALV